MKNKKSMKMLPLNCEIERFSDDESDFRIWFYCDNGDDYVSEIYCRCNDETFEQAAFAVCEKFGWIENPPNRANKLVK